MIRRGIINFTISGIFDIGQPIAFFTGVDENRSDSISEKSCAGLSVSIENILSARNIYRCEAKVKGLRNFERPFTYKYLYRRI